MNKYKKNLESETDPLFIKIEQNINLTKQEILVNQFTCIIFF